MKDLNELNIAILLTDGFEEVELTKPREALEDAGATTHLISPQKDIRAWNEKEWGGKYEADVLLDEANSKDYDGLMLPGGVLNPDKLRMNDTAIKFISDFMGEGKPIAAICHGPQLLIETGKLKGRRMTSYPAIKTDLMNAGVNWVDEEVVVDEGLVTSRDPGDIPAFNKKMIEEFREGVHREMAR